MSLTTLLIITFAVFFNLILCQLNGAYKKSEYFGAYHKRLETGSSAKLTSTGGNNGNNDGKYKFEVITSIVYQKVRICSLAISGFQLQDDTMEVNFQGKVSGDDDQFCISGQNYSQFEIQLTVRSSTEFGWLDYTVIIITENIPTNYVQIIIDGNTFVKINSMQAADRTQNWGPISLDIKDDGTNTNNIIIYDLIYGVILKAGDEAEFLRFPKYIPNLVSNQYTVTYTTRQQLQSSTTKIWKTILAFDKSSPSRPPRMKIQANSWAVDNSTDNVLDRFGLSSEYDNSANGRCLVGISKFRFEVGKNKGIGFQVVNQNLQNLALFEPGQYTLDLFCLSEFKCDSNLAQMKKHSDGSWFCLQCQQNCINCDSQDNCIDCQERYYVNASGGCGLCSDKFNKCSTCNSNECIKCQSHTLQLLSNKSSCQCPFNTIYVFNGCTDRQGCLNQVDISQNTQICTMCDYNKGFYRSFNGSLGRCLCRAGYKLDENSLLEISQIECMPVCGDGIYIKGSEQCDDGNLLNDDGCSKECLKQDGYICQEKIIQNIDISADINEKLYISLCKVIIPNLRIEVVYFWKNLRSNTGTVELQMRPNLVNLTQRQIQKAGTKMFSFEVMTYHNESSEGPSLEINSITSFQLLSYSSQTGRMTYSFSYNSTIQAQIGRIYMDLNQSQKYSSPIAEKEEAIKVNQPSPQLYSRYSKFTVKGMNAHLICNDDQIKEEQTLLPHITLIQYGTLATVILNALFFFVSLKWHKMIGLQTIQFLQVLFILLVAGIVSSSSSQMNSVRQDHQIQSSLWRQSLYPTHFSAISRQIKFLIIGAPVSQILCCWAFSIIQIDVFQISSSLSQKYTMMGLGKQIALNCIVVTCVLLIATLVFVALIAKYKKSQADSLSQDNEKQADQQNTQKRASNSKNNSANRQGNSLKNKSNLSHSQKAEYFVQSKKCMQSWYDHVIFPLTLSAMWSLYFSLIVQLSIEQQPKQYIFPSQLNSLTAFFLLGLVLVVIAGELSVIVTNPLEIGRNLLLSNYYNDKDDDEDKEINKYNQKSGIFTMNSMNEMVKNRLQTSNSKNEQKQKQQKLAKNISKDSIFMNSAAAATSNPRIISRLYIPIFICQNILICAFFILLVDLNGEKYYSESILRTQIFYSACSLLFVAKLLYFIYRTYCTNLTVPHLIPYSLNFHNKCLIFYQISKLLVSTWLLVKSFSFFSNQIEIYLCYAFGIILGAINVLLGCFRIYRNKKAEFSDVWESVHQYRVSLLFLKKNQLAMIEEQFENNCQLSDNEAENDLNRNKNVNKQGKSKKKRKYHTLRDNPFLMENQIQFQAQLEAMGLQGRYHEFVEKQFLAFRQRRPQKQRTQEEQVKLDIIKKQLKQQLKELKRLHAQRKNY